MMIEGPPLLALDAKGGVSSQFIHVGVACISISIHLSILVLWTCMNYLCDVMVGECDVMVGEVPRTFLNL
jgi:hypothetical protein